MAIGVDGQFIVQVKIGNNAEFIERDDFLGLTIIEEAGNVLPTFSLTFKSTDEDIISQLNENNLIELKMGRDLQSLQDIELSTTKLKTQKEGADFRIYEATGFASEIDYITEHTLNITDNVSGVEAALEVANKSFKRVTSNITKSADKQVWIQHNITGKRFVSNCLMHADVSNSFPAFALTAEGEFILKDVNKLLSAGGIAPYDWRLVKEPTKRLIDIPFDSDYQITSKAGFINNWMGYGRETIVYDLITGKTEVVHEEPEVVLSLSKEVDKSSSISERYAGTQVQSDNVHGKYWESYNHNLMSLSNLSKVDVMTSFSNNYYPVKPLDLIMLNDKSTSNENVAGEYTSGIYIASKVVRQIEADMMVTTLVLNREAFNRVK